MYRRNIYKMGRVVEVHNFYPANYGAPGMPRSAKRKKTPEEMKRQNELNRLRKLQRIMLANFSSGDWHLVLKYRPSDRPESIEEAKKRLTGFLNKMRYHYKKAGYLFKFICITERGKHGGAIHHHLIIEDISSEKLNTVKTVKLLWQYGNTYWSDMYEEGGFEGLADYFLKKEGKEENSGEAYTRSRNLIIPEPERRVMHRKRWPEEPKPLKGYEIIKNSILNGTNKVTGYPYQYYSMRKLETPKERRERIEAMHCIRKRKCNKKNEKRKTTPSDIS